ncbi:MAG: ubiquinone/menaquinone biosynthesis methyltransferase [Bacteroidales bacterium]|nr:ubiquinone/menaquinone biosynthesis methyltransferase [Bacteroidales bacterium]
MAEKELDKNAEVISGMFDSIARKYDRMNHGMSLGIDRLWRWRFVRRLEKKLPENPVVLDLACGTGDLTRALSRKGFSVTGLDISAEMMEVGKRKCADLTPRPAFVLGSAEQIPFPDATFDAVTIAFGLRNFDHRAQCLAEIRRVLKPGGRLAVLEFAVPRNRLWRALYLF